MKLKNSSFLILYTSFTRIKEPQQDLRKPKTRRSSTIPLPRFFANPPQQTKNSDKLNQAKNPMKLKNSSSSILYTPSTTTNQELQQDQQSQEFDEAQRVPFARFFNLYPEESQEFETQEDWETQERQELAEAQRFV